MQKLAGLAAGVSHGLASLRARRDWRVAVETSAKEAAARREADFEDELAPRRAELTRERLTATGHRAYTVVRCARRPSCARDSSASSRSGGICACPSHSLIPRADDRSTLFIVAGMQPQMPFFLGREQPPAPLTTSVPEGASRGGKDTDLEDVGLDTYHHCSFFEMLGNFSFGQYFKERRDRRTRLGVRHRAS